MFRHFALCFADLVSTNRTCATRIERHFAGINGTERFASRRGMVSLTAHPGNWELGGRLLARRSARRTYVVVADDDRPDLDRWMRRDGDGLQFMPRSRPTTALALLAALRAGDVVAVQGDRALGDRGDVRVPFFGAPAPFPRGPFPLARACGVPVVPAFCVLGPDRGYRVHVHEPLMVPRDGEVDALRRWVGILESEVSAHPTQWFNFFDVWDPVHA